MLINDLSIKTYENTSNKPAKPEMTQIQYDNKTIFACEYKLYIPSEQQLIEELQKEIEK